MFSDIPSDPIVIISKFLQDKDKIHLTHTNKSNYSVQSLISLDIPILANTQCDFIHNTVIWDIDLPITPHTDNIIVKNLKHTKRSDIPYITLPEFISHAISLKIFKYKINPPLKLNPNIQSLTIDYISNDIILPTSLTYLNITHLENNSTINFHELTNLKELYVNYVTDGNYSIDLSNHPNLKVINFNNTNFEIDLSCVHDLEYLSYYGRFNAPREMLPKLKSLKSYYILTDIMEYKDLEELGFDIYNRSFQVNDFQNLTYFDGMGHNQGFNNKPMPNLKYLYTMSAYHLEEVNDRLFPKLEECMVRSLEYLDLMGDEMELGDPIMIDHDNLKYLDCRMMGALVIKSAPKLERISYIGREIYYKDDVVLESLKEIALKFEKRFPVGQEEDIVIDLGRMPNLERIISVDTRMEIIGELGRLKGFMDRGGLENVRIEEKENGCGSLYCSGGRIGVRGVRV